MVLEQIIKNSAFAFEIVESILMFILTTLAVKYAKKSWKEQVRLPGKIVAREMFFKDIDWNNDYIPITVTIANIGETSVENISVFIDGEFFKVIPFVMANEKIDLLVARYSTRGHVMHWLDDIQISSKVSSSVDLCMPYIEVRENSIFLKRLGEMCQYEI